MPARCRMAWRGFRCEERAEWTSTVKTERALCTRHMRVTLAPSRRLTAREEMELDAEDARIEAARLRQAAEEAARAAVMDEMQGAAA